MEQKEPSFLEVKMLKTLIVFLSLLSFVACNSSNPPPSSSGTENETGGSISSGGELIRDSHNPWWVKNTKDVSYCISIDSSTISAEPQRIEKLVQRALQFWKKQGELDPRFYPKESLLAVNQIGFATQKFTQVDCNQSPDLRFLFGVGSLSELQRQQIGRPERFVAAAVRTSYDQVQLRGEGFIYVSSDLGPQRYNSSGKFVEAPWSYDILLYPILQHELGHVFGVPHVGMEFSLMSQQFPEFILSDSMARILLRAGGFRMEELEVSRFFSPSPRFSLCKSSGGLFDLDENTRSFFDLKKADLCLKLELSEDGKQIDVYSSSQYEVDYTKIGIISGYKKSSSLIPGVLIQLPQGQTVFPSSNAQSWPYLAGPWFANAVFEGGELRLLSGLKRGVSIELQSSALTYNSWILRGVLNGRIVNVLTHSAP